MTILENVILVLMVGYSIYRQVQLHEVVGDSRFKLAIIYGVIGLIVGSYQLPFNSWEIIATVISLSLGIIVGLLRGKYCHVWADQGRVYTKGTVFTLSLFIGLLVVKIGMGTISYINGSSNSGTFGDILVMIALMIAFQSEVVWRRAKPLGARRSDKTEPASVPAAS